MDWEGEGKVFQQSAEHDLASAEAKVTLAIPLPSGDLDFRFLCWRERLLGGEGRVMWEHKRPVRGQGKVIIPEGIAAVINSVHCEFQFEDGMMGTLLQKEPRVIHLVLGLTLVNS